MSVAKEDFIEGKITARSISCMTIHDVPMSFVFEYLNEEKLLIKLLNQMPMNFVIITLLETNNLSSDVLEAFKKQLNETKEEKKKE